MADTIVKAKIQLRSTSVTSNGSSNGSGDKTPTTPSKLMINHGKPNFTIQRSPKVQENGDVDPFTNGKNNNYNAYKTAGTQNYSSNNNNNNVVVSTKFNGAFKATNVPIIPKQPHQSDASDNEAAKVVLRRAKAPEQPTVKDNNEDEDDSVPEFIRRQRRIQERLANQNILDFESRRSGYFTHVMISPTSPNRQSFGATMSSPPVVPALETPAAPNAAASVNEETKAEEIRIEPVMTNGNGNSDEHTQHKLDELDEEEEVAKAIEEVNKAVEGEDYDIKDEQNAETPVEVVEAVEVAAVAIPEPTIEHVHEEVQKSTTEIENTNNEPASQDANVTAVEEHAVENGVDADEPESAPQQNGHIEVVEVHASQENGHNDIIISHTNGFDGPNIPAPDPSGALGVNFEPKTVVSFSKDLGSEPNKYPDTVKVLNQNGDTTATATATPIDEKLQELSKLKFDITADEQGNDVQVTPVLRAD